MAEIAQVEDSEFTPWYVDESNEPLCPSSWEDFECEKSTCPFSHELAKYQFSLVLTEDLSENIRNLYKYVKEYLETSGVKEPLQNYKLNQNLEEEKDIGRIDQLISEMVDFERGPGVQAEDMCPFVLETGNCLIRMYCEYAHSADEMKGADGERNSEWYPSSMDCECCKGYIYGCSAEECKKSEECLVCVL